MSSQQSKVSKMIGALAKGDSSSAQILFKEAMTEKVGAALDARKIVVAGQIYNESVELDETVGKSLSAVLNNKANGEDMVDHEGHSYVRRGVKSTGGNEGQPGSWRKVKPKAKKK